LTIPSTLADRSIFRGWLVVAAAFAVMFVGFGSAYTFSAFVEPLQRDFGASRGSISVVFSIAGFLYFALGIVSGPLAARLGGPPPACLLTASVGWRGAYLGLGIIALLIGGGLSLLIENDPKDRGLGPAGDPPRDLNGATGATGASVREAVRSTRFVGLYASCL